MEFIVRTLSGASGPAIGLVIALALIGAAALLGPLDERKHLRQPLGFLIAHAVFRALELLLEDGSTLQRIASVLSFALLLASIGRASVLLIIDVILGRRLDRKLPTIIRDIVQGIVYFVLALAVLRHMGLEPGQLLTTSALLTAVVGLSLQETLGNLIAGLSVQVQRPFNVGDWVQFDADPKNIGRVKEVNWRATTLVTLDQIELIVPNGLLAKSALKNFTRPTKVVRRSVLLQLGYEVPPRRAHQVILEAASDTPGVLKEPTPTVVTNNFLDSGIEYWLRFFIEEFDRRDIIDGLVRDRIWYGLQRAGLAIPFPQRVVHMQQQDEETRAAETERTIVRRDRALADVDFLSVISPEQRRLLSELATTRLFSPGEIIVRQGEESDELYVILRGQVAVVLENDGSETEVARLDAGKYFGEMALLTGERRRATVKAARDCELVLIDREAFQRVLHEAPGASERLSTVLAERQVELDEHAARFTAEERASVVHQESNKLLGRIKRLFTVK
ncbi:MAG: mechanosensitive ion channel [Polyangiaceae bacterium]